MTPALCTCGHPQILHMGPLGACRVWSVTEVDKPRCKCSAFELAVPAVVAPELERSDLQ